MAAAGVERRDDVNNAPGVGQSSERRANVEVKYSGPDGSCGVSETGWVGSRAPATMGDTRHDNPPATHTSTRLSTLGLRDGGRISDRRRDDRWTQLTNGLPDNTQVQAITVHPTNPDVVYLGTRSGPYRTADRGEHWERLPFPDDKAEVWSILVHPANPRILYAGTSPVGVYRSDDGGDSWRRLPNAVQPERVKMKSFTCRVMRLVADPPAAPRSCTRRSKSGRQRSLDGGETWDDCSSTCEAGRVPQLKSKSTATPTSKACWTGTPCA